MPFIIRIILQRVALLVLAGLAFLGINPDISIPSPEATSHLHERQQDFIDFIFLGKVQNGATDPDAFPQDDSIADIQRELNQAIAQRVDHVLPPPLPLGGSEATATPGFVHSAFDIKEVVVNLMCLEKTSRYTRMTSGSGVIISSTGLVLTNAHVAYPLLKTKQFGDNTYTCTVRRGGISNFGYNTELVYYPLDWLDANKDVIKGPSPVGTGENDYAIILITTPTGLAPKTTVFPFASLAVSTSDFVEGKSVSAAGYPSDNTGVFEVDTSPGLKIVETTIDDFFTFGTNTLDILQTGTNLISRRGSSGGGVFNGNKLYGLVVTTNDEGRGPYLNALTIPYIKRDFAHDTGMNLDTFVTTSLDVLKMRFSVSYMQLLRDIMNSSSS